MCIAQTRPIAAFISRVIAAEWLDQNHWTVAPIVNERRIRDVIS